MLIRVGPAPTIAFGDARLLEETLGAVGEVALTEVLGAETVLYADLTVRDGNGDTQRLALRHPGDGAPVEGDRIGVLIEPSDLSWFNAEGRRIG